MRHDSIKRPSASVFASKLGSAFACLALAATAVWPQTDGYRLRSDRVEVQTQADWQTWNFPTDMVEISPTGTVQSRFVRVPANAMLDVGDFSYLIDNSLRAQYANSFEDEDGKLKARGGIKQAGSNFDQVHAVTDGDATTFWEPDTADPLQDWVVEIDLGRLVSATKVVVRFAEDGDPFLQFRTHAAGGLNPFGTADRSGALDYTLIGGTNRPNRDQRVFEFDLEPSGPHTEEWTGRPLQYIRISATATNGARAERISESDYLALGTDNQGQIEYIWNIAGEERQVTAADHDQLPPEQQGEVRHYRRERPRLAEVEVWTVGDNIAIGTISRGGSLHDVNPNSSPELAFDGNMRTEWQGMVYFETGETAEWGLLNVDLGAHFLLHAVRVVTRTGGTPLFGYQTRGSDGSLAPDGSYIWEELSRESRQLNQNTRLFEDNFDPRPVRFLEFRNMDIARRTRAHEGHRILSTVTEIQVFGQGHLPILEMNSGIIDLSDAKNLTTIGWTADTPPGTAVEVRTRTGDDLREVNRYFKKDGTEVANKEEYDSQPTFFRGDIITEFLPGPGWSNWSQAYIEPGEAISSPSPRRYMMLQASLLTQDVAQAASLQSIQVNFASPLAKRIIGEIEPKRDIPIGDITDFDLYIHPSFSGQDPGFNRIRLTAPSRTGITLQQVGMGSESDFTAGTEDSFTPALEDRFENATGQALELIRTAPDTLQLELPETLGQGGAEIVRLSFAARVFSAGATFEVEVGHSDQADNWQKVDGEDAVELADGEGLTVLTTDSGKQVKVIEISPATFTPNGDGINDVTVFSFSVLKVNVAREVAVELFDLSGRSVRRLSETRNLANGLYRMVWDGRDTAGNSVPPGMYLARLSIDNDTGNDNAVTRLVGVVY
jgi:hypothetical protein